MNGKRDSRALLPIWREAELVSAVESHLESGGYRVRREVPNMGQSADLVAVRGRWVTFVEAKVSDWGRALRQCVAHELVADFICIAIGTKYLSEALRCAAEERGYGLIHCPSSSRECDFVLRPRRNGNVWAPQRRLLAKYLRNLSDVD